MMTVSPKEISEYPWWVRLFFFKQRMTYGKVLEPGLLWARSPSVFAAVALLYGALNRNSSPISGVIRSLVTVRISQINHCAFCVDINTATLIKRGVPQNKIDQLSNWRESDKFDENERLALEYAEAVTIPSVGVNDALRDRVHSTFGNDATIELTGLIAFQNLSSKFNSALDVPPQGFCILPDPKNRP